MIVEDHAMRRPIHRHRLSLPVVYHPRGTHHRYSLTLIIEHHAWLRHIRLLLSIKNNARRSLGHHHMLTIRIDEPTRRKTRRRLVTRKRLVHHHGRKAEPDWRPLRMEGLR